MRYFANTKAYSHPDAWHIMKKSSFYLTCTTCPKEGEVAI